MATVDPGRRRLPMPAVVTGDVARWLLRQVPPESWQATEQWHDANGRSDYAARMRQARAMLLEADLQDREYRRPSVSGSAEANSAEVGADSDDMSECTTDKAAERLNVGTRRVVQLIDEGALMARKVGRTWLVDVASVDTLVNLRRSA